MSPHLRFDPIAECSRSLAQPSERGQRVPHPTDRRTTLAEITDPGRTVAVAVAVAATEELNRTQLGTAPLKRAELDMLTSILEGVRPAAGDFEPDARPR